MYLSSLVSGTAPIVTIPASPTTEQDVSDEALYSPACSMNGATSDKEQLGYPGHTSPATDQPIQSQTRIYSPAGSINRATGDIEQLGYPGNTSPTTDQPIQPQTRIYSPAGSMNRATGDLEQLECWILPKKNG